MDIDPYILVQENYNYDNRLSSSMLDRVISIV